MEREVHWGIFCVFVINSRKEELRERLDILLASKDDENMEPINLILAYYEFITGTSF